MPAPNRSSADAARTTATLAPSSISLGQEATSALVEAWKTLRKRWLWIVTLTAGVLVATGFYTAGQRRIYSSSCVLQIDPTPPKPLGRDVQAVVDIGAPAHWANNEYYRTQFEIIRSRTVSEETVRRLGLQHDKAFLQGRQPQEPVGSPEATSDGGRSPSVEDTAARVRANLSVDPVKESRLVRVSYRDASPERARQILATLVGVYVDRNIDVALDSTNTAAEWLRDQVDKLRRELDGTEMALHDYKTGNRILSISLEDQSNMLRQEIQQLSQALTEVRVRRAKVAAQAEELSKLEEGSKDGNDLSGSELLAHGPLQQLRVSLGEAVAQRDALIGEGKAAMHPLVASAEARVTAAREAVAQEASNVIRAVGRDRSITDREVQSLSVLLEQAQQRALQLGRLEVDYRRLERNKTNTEKLYSLVIERSKESDLTRMMRFNNIQTIDPPTTPNSPVSPRVPLNLALGMFGGLALGLFAAFAREMFDQTVKSPSDIEHELGMTFLGFVPRFDATTSTPVYGSRSKPRRRRVEDVHPELIVHDAPMSAASEAARAIRTNISFMSPDKPYRTILITSAGPSEGKTTVACCLATAMAQAGHRTLLVDADLRRPRVHRVFERTNDRGLSDALLDRSKLPELIQSTQVPGLSVLLSGPSCPSPAENLQSESFQKVLAELESRFDRVLIDSPPVAPITDAVILSTRVDATILVVRALTSVREAVRHARRSLQDVRANLIGSVLNAADPSRRGYPEYYRYYGGREVEKEDAKQSAKQDSPSA
ncbi:MAG: hypothetical protein RL685_7687 [Pseudomonadota bacterium]|jgi:capsular exopolysaccharide synthesis family protein